jgi:hypothetical protein
MLTRSTCAHHRDYVSVCKPPRKGTRVLDLLQLPTKLFPSPEWSNTVATQVPLSRYRRGRPRQFDNRRSDGQLPFVKPPPVGTYEIV